MYRQPLFSLYKTLLWRVALLFLLVFVGFAVPSTPASTRALDSPPIQRIHKHTFASESLLKGGLIFRVNSTADPGDGVCDDTECTLREAVIAANNQPGPDEIVLPAGTYTLTAVGNNEDAAQTGDLDISDDVYIHGNTAETTIIDGYEMDRVFQVMANTQVKLRDLTVKNGAAYDGGGIMNHGHLTIINSTIAHNRLYNWIEPDTGPNDGAGIYNVGTLQITGSKFIDNWTDESIGDGYGGAIFNAGTLKVSNSFFTQNWSAGGGAVYTNGGNVTITNCNMTSNWSRFFGGAVENGGGVVVINSSTISNSNDSIMNTGPGSMTINNSTVSNNYAFRVTGGIWNASGQLQVTHSTIVFNDTGGSPYDGGITGAATLAYTIVAHNGERDCVGAITSLGYNLDSDGSCGLTSIGDLTADPLLGPLQNNGGPTPTFALLPGSPAIDANITTTCLLPRDQRGNPRPQDGNGDNVVGCDIGSFERR